MEPFEDEEVEAPEAAPVENKVRVRLVSPWHLSGFKTPLEPDHEVTRTGTLVPASKVQTIVDEAAKVGIALVADVPEGGDSE